MKWPQAAVIMFSGLIVGWSTVTIATLEHTPPTAKLPTIEVEAPKTNCPAEHWKEGVLIAANKPYKNLWVGTLKLLDGSLWEVFTTRPLGRRGEVEATNLAAVLKAGQRVCLSDTNHKVSISDFRILELP